MTMIESDLNLLLEAYRANGRLAFLYPRKRRISLNGGRLRPIPEAVTEMRECLARDAERARSKVGAPESVPPSMDQFNHLLKQRFVRDAVK